MWLKRAALPGSQSENWGAQRSNPFQSLQSKWLSWDKPEFGPNPFLFETKTCFRWKSTKASRGKILPPGKKLGSNRRGQDWWGRGREMSRRDVPSYTHCGERKERLPRRQPQLFHSASIRRWKWRQSKLATTRDRLNRFIYLMQFKRPFNPMSQIVKDLERGSQEASYENSDWIYFYVHTQSTCIAYT